MSNEPLRMLKKSFHNVCVLVCTLMMYILRIVVVVGVHKCT